jgi:hypothetical protein
MAQFSFYFVELEDPKGLGTPMLDLGNQVTAESLESGR